jgi:hypothetical protein
MIRSRAMAARWLLLASVVLAILVGIAANGTPTGLGGALLYLLPPLLLLLALAMRRYPGERALLALMGRSRYRGRHPRVDGARPRLRPRVVVPRGGRLIASSLAVRPPPVPAGVSLN